LDDGAIPPPPDMPPDESGLESSDPDEFQSFLPGRLVVTVHRGSDIGKHDAKSGISATKVDPYINMTLGKAKNAVKLKGKTIKKSTKEVDFRDEAFRFVVDDPPTLAFQGDIALGIYVYDSNMISDTLLGQGDFSLVNVFQSFKETAWVNLNVAHKTGTLPAGKLHISVSFQPARKGGLVITCKEGRGLKNMEMFGKQDPYCVFEMGKTKKRTKTIKDGGTDPQFRNEQVPFWIDSSAWSSNIAFSCWDEDVGSDDLIGRGEIDFMSYCSNANNLAEFMEEGMLGEVELVLDIFQKSKKSGEIVLGIEFFPCGELTVTTIEGRNLLEKDGLGQQDPYCEYTTMGSIVNHKRKTKVDTDGGTEPIWNEVLKFAVMDHHEMTLEVYDHDRFSSNDLIGGASFSLLEVFKLGTIDTWVQLKNRNSWGSVETCGEIHIILDFIAPKGVSYPVRKPDIPGFDDSMRVNRFLKEKEDALRQQEQDALQEAKRFGLVEDDPNGTGIDSGPAVVALPPRSDEFSDAEVQQAFEFIDINKNGFISAAEIRHLLICMGEMITDEEVDEMIRMVDSDGDGQVSFEEFYALVTDPDPSRADFDSKTIAEAMQAAAEGQARESAEQRAAELKQKHEKVS
jgi:hypothetical protein